MTRPDDPYFSLSNTGSDHYSGASVREVFAAMALQGLIAAPRVLGLDTSADTARHYAEAAVTYADALITALNAKETIRAKH